MKSNANQEPRPEKGKKRPRVTFVNRGVMRRRRLSRKGGAQVRRGGSGKSIVHATHKEETLSKVSK